MITPNKRAELRKIAQSLEPVMQVGKDGLSINVINTSDQALYARELIKITVLESCENTVREVANEMSERCGADIVQVIGRKIVLYKPNLDKKNRNKK